MATSGSTKVRTPRAPKAAPAAAPVAETASAAPANASSGSPAWDAKMAILTEALELPADQIAAALKGVVGAPSVRGAKLLGNPNYAPEIAAALAALGVPTLVLKEAVAGLSDAPTVPTATATATAAAGAVAAFTQAPMTSPLLIAPPGDDDLLRTLKIGGRPVFATENIAAVIRAAVAAQNGLFNLPKTLVDAIQREAVSKRKPNPPILVQVRKELAKRSDMAAIFADLLPEGDATGTAYVTEADRKAALEAFDRMWPSFIGFQERLRAFRAEVWMAKMTSGMMGNMAGMHNNPMDMMSGLQGLDPALLMGQTLQTEQYVDDSEGLIEALNGVFMGQGLYASRMLGAEAARLQRILQMDGLLTAVGATDFDDMLRTLGIGVTNDVVRAQQNLVSWTINVVDLQNKDPNALVPILVTLCNIGDGIPWEKLSNGRAKLAPDDRLRTALPGIGNILPRRTGTDNNSPDGRRNF